MTVLGKCRKCKCCCKKKRCHHQSTPSGMKKHIEKVFESNQDCQYCGSETLEIAVEIDGVGDEDKEGVFVVEKTSSQCEWKYDLTEDGSELILTVYSDEVLETYIMVRWVDKDKFPIHYWLFVEEEVGLECIWDGAVASGDVGSCVIYSL